MKLKTKKITKAKESQYMAYENKFGIDLMVKRFLTIEEVGEVVNNCLSQTDPLKRRIVYYSSLVELATNIDIEQFINEENLINADQVYNVLAENELFGFADEISNVYDIMMTIHDVESPYNIIKGAVEELGKNVNSDELVKSLADVSQSLKDQQAIHNELMQ